MFSTQELRNVFIDYCQKLKHHAIASASMVPKDDASLLFINAGMAPFKKYFLGDKPPYPSLVSVQRCLRAGGKHNDLDNVGYTTRHHTFFEMLGNFSFGAYFKKEAIQLAWRFLTTVLKLSPEKLWITVLKDDQETATIWLQDIKIDPTRLVYCSDDTNFWSMGDTGPCGPSTEIFYDHGPAVKGGPPGSVDAEGDRYVEIWNLVFTQFERTKEKQLIPLPTPCIDTGMGLERLAAVLQGVVSNYDTDIFVPLIKAASYLFKNSETVSKITLCVIADHLRASSFLILDGIHPGNEGRSYVLRRIIRRAIRHAYQAGLKEPFLYQLVPVLVAQMQSAYPELASAANLIERVLLAEEQQFLKTLHQGIQFFEKMTKDLSQGILPGTIIFTLYDTYGFPPDLTFELAQKKGLTYDQAGFEAELDLQKQRSRASSMFSSETIPNLNEYTNFVGYETLCTNTCIQGILTANKQSTNQLNAGEQGSLLLEATPFYAESGGQIGDQGSIITSNKISYFDVLDTQKSGNVYVHFGVMKTGSVHVGDHVKAQVKVARRLAISRHHTATHLLHAALRKQLGTDISQKGSLVTVDYLRFDFNYSAALSFEDITAIEHQINQIIWENHAVAILSMSFEEAKKTGALALFEDKYQEAVRVLKIEDYSIELCGGTHVNYTGHLGLFKIIDVTSIASGIKRITAVVGEAAFHWIKSLEQQMQETARLLNTPVSQVNLRLQKQMDVTKAQSRTIEVLETYLNHNIGKTLLTQKIQIEDIYLIVAQVPKIISGKLRSLIDQLKIACSHPIVIVLGTLFEDSLNISIGVSKNLTNTINAKELLSHLADRVEGKGGGRPDFAQLQSKMHKPEALKKVLQAVKPWLLQRLSKQSDN